MKKLNLNLTSPCKSCPFRKTAAGFFTRERAKEIIEAIAGSSHASFSCHQTNEFGEDENGDSTVTETEKSEHCAGALILLHKTKQPNLAMRFGYLLGIFDGEKLRNQDQVFDSAEQFIKRNS